MKMLRLAAPHGHTTRLSRSGIRFSIWLLLILGTVALFRVSYSTATTTGPNLFPANPRLASLSKTPVFRLENTDDRRIRLSEGRELLTAYDGSEEAVKIMNDNEATPLATASDDFDEDGMPDLVCAYTSPGGSILALHSGNIDAIYPNMPEAKQRRALGTFTDAPFLAPARLFQSSAIPEMIGAGDFNADDHRDLITAKIGDNAIWFYAGDGHGNFAAARPIPLPGNVTAMTVGEINRRDGLPDIVVGIAGAAGAKALILESPLGAINAQPESFDLPMPATVFALGNIVGGYEQDLAIAAGKQLIVIGGRDRKLSIEASNQPPVKPAQVVSRSFNANIKSLVIGNFGNDTRADMAMLCDDGSVRISHHPAQAFNQRKKISLAAWRTETLATGPWPMAAKMICARVSSNPIDNLLVLDSVSHRLNIIDPQMETPNKQSKATASASPDRRTLTAALVAEDEVMAAQPMRLSNHALNDLVVLNRRRSAPVVVFSVASIFTVGSTLDTSDSTPGDGVCDDGGGNCTLRAAIQEANANAGADTINFSIGTGVQTIPLTGTLPSITEAVTIDGTTQTGFAGTPIIELDCTNVLENGLQVLSTGGNSTIRGLVINRYNSSSEAISLASNGNIVEGNFLGTNVSGTAVPALGKDGVFVDTGTGNLIGGTVAAARNLISGNDKNGIFLVSSSPNNTVQGNFIGTNISGTGGLGNGLVGVNGGFTENNETIGGTAAGTGNVISDNTNSAINLNGSGSLIQGNLIGTDVNGTASLANSVGVSLLGNLSSGNTVGGVTVAARNVISGNSGDGVSIDGGSNNAVQGNFIGTNATGTAALGNFGFGVSMFLGATSNTVGGTVAGARNIISGNNGNGVSAQGAGSDSNIIQGNFIGTDVNGTTAFPNNDGIVISSSSNMIGGTASGSGNLISGNNANGVRLSGATGTTIQGNRIGTDAAGTAALTNFLVGVFIFAANNNLVGGTAAGSSNLISGNAEGGVAMVNTSTGNQVEGNFVGTDITGTSAIPNAFNGVNSAGISVVSASSNTIGGTASGAGNLVSGNTNAIGIRIGNGSTTNLVEGNLVGTDASGTAPLANISGIVIDASSGNTIGGLSAAARNVCAANGDGIRIDNGSNNNVIQGNFSGTDITGTVAIPNLNFGVIISNGSNNLIGGTSAAARNVLSGNAFSGINLFTSAATNNTVQGNFIGVDITGTVALPNSISGVRINGGINNLIGGTTADAANVVSGNPVGFTFLNSANGNTVQHNFIGTAANGVDPLGNLGDGINLDSGSSNNTIGGTVTGAGNVIARNAGAGIDVISGTGNAFLSNFIDANVGLGIDLNNDGVTANDAGDADTSPNNLQNFPVLTQLTTGATTAIQGTLNSTPNTNFRIEFFSNLICNPSGHGQARGFIGFTNVITDGSGNATINVTFPISIVPNNVVTMTATDSSNNTSEFSACAISPVSCTINCPPNQNLTAAANQCSATVNYPAPTTTGSCGTVTCTPPSGSVFAVGTTAVTCTTGVGPTCSFNVTAADHTPPVLACPQNIIKPPDPGLTTAVINYTPAAVSDNCAGAAVLCLPPSGFAAPLGTTTVTCTATDAASNTTVCAFTVTVPDSPLIIGCPADVSVTVEPNQTTATVTYPSPTITDTLPNVTVACAPPSGSTFSLGVTAVSCTAKDAVGHQAACDFNVNVLGGTPVGHVIIPDSQSVIRFGAGTPVNVNRKPPKSSSLPCGLFSIQNDSLTPLRLTLASINRTGADVDKGRVTDAAESGLYELNEVLENGDLSPVAVGSAVTVAVGAQRNFCLKFGPAIPALAGATTGLHTPQAIPDVVNSRVTFSIAGAGPLIANVNAQVETDVRLINPKKPKKPAVVSFSSSGDDFIVSFSAFDSNMDVNKASYELLDGKGNRVAGPFDIDLAQPIKAKNLVRGQSFSVEQRFTGARNHPEIKGARVTVSDSETKVVGAASVSPSVTLSATSSEQAGGPMIAPPPVTLKRPHP